MVCSHCSDERDAPKSFVFDSGEYKVLCEICLDEFDRHYLIINGAQIAVVERRE